MKTTKNLVIMASIFLQFAGSLYGSSAWQAAFIRFGGNEDPAMAAANVLKSPASLTLNNALKIATSLGTPEAHAVAAYRTQGSTKAFKVGRYTAADVKNAANEIIADAQSRAIENQPVVEPTVQEPTPSKGWGWFGGSSAATTPVITPANVQAAVKQQQQADLALAAGNNDALARIISSGKSGVSLYTAFIDYIFSVLQQAVNSIADAKTQQQVLSYMQSKFANMKASVAANNYRSNTLGRMNSKIVKKSSKKDKHKNL